MKQKRIPLVGEQYLVPFILYLFFSANYLYAGIFIVAFIILHVLVVYADSHAHKHRKIRTEARTE